MIKSKVRSNFTAIAYLSKEFKGGFNIHDIRKSCIERRAVVYYIDL